MAFTVAGVVPGAVDVTVTTDAVLVTVMADTVVVVETGVVVVVVIVVVVVKVVLIPEATIKVVCPVKVTGIVFVFITITVTVAGGIRCRRVEQILLSIEGNCERRMLIAWMTDLEQSAAARSARGVFGYGSNAEALIRRQ